jgi:hypothetical protein
LAARYASGAGNRRLVLYNDEAGIAFTASAPVKAASSTPAVAKCRYASQRSSSGLERGGAAKRHARQTGLNDRPGYYCGDSGGKP